MKHFLILFIILGATRGFALPQDIYTADFIDPAEVLKVTEKYKNRSVSNPIEISVPILSEDYHELLKKSSGFVTAGLGQVDTRITRYRYFKVDLKGFDEVEKTMKFAKEMETMVVLDTKRETTGETRSKLYGPRDFYIPYAIIPKERIVLKMIRQGLLEGNRLEMRDKKTGALIASICEGCSESVIQRRIEKAQASYKASASLLVELNLLKEESRFYRGKFSQDFLSPYESVEVLVDPSSVIDVRYQDQKNGGLVAALGLRKVIRDVNSKGPSILNHTLFTVNLKPGVRKLTRFYSADAIGNTQLLPEALRAAANQMASYYVLEKHMLNVLDAAFEQNKMVAIQMRRVTDKVHREYPNYRLEPKHDYLAWTNFRVADVPVEEGSEPLYYSSEDPETYLSARSYLNMRDLKQIPLEDLESRFPDITALETEEEKYNALNMLMLSNQDRLPVGITEDDRDRYNLLLVFKDQKGSDLEVNLGEPVLTEAERTKKEEEEALMREQYELQLQKVIEESKKSEALEAEATQGNEEVPSEQINPDNTDIPLDEGESVSEEVQLEEEQ